MKPSAYIARGNPGEDAAGVSMSFDPQALQEQEEAEFAREEQQRQHELQALLRQALDDGLTDDEDDDDEEGEVSQATFDHDISSEISSVSDQPPHMLWPDQGGPSYEDMQSGNQESNPAGHAPYMSDRYAQENQRQKYQSAPGAPSAGKTVNEMNLYHHPQGNHIQSMHNANPQGPQGYKPHFENASGPGMRAADEVNHQPINSDPINYPYENAVRNTADYSNYPIMTGPSVPHHSEDGADEYRVRYRGPKPTTTTTMPSAEVNGDTATASAYSPELRSLQEDFISAGGVTENSRLGQLQILYNARGRKIEELDNQLKQLQDDSSREIRILKHKMALMQDEKFGAEGSLEQCQSMLSNSQESENKLQGKVKAMEATIQTLQDAKTELVNKLQTAESSVESLNSQLIELGSSDSLARARQHHESAVGAMQKKYDAEIISLKEKLDQQSQENFEKSNENSLLRKQIDQLGKSAEEAQISKADTINRLTRSLEESQRQCQQLLESNSGQESSRLKIQLQEAVAAKSISEDLNNALQDEIRDLKEQLTIYESASTFGVLPSGMTSTPAAQQYSAEDSFAQLGLRKARTPGPVDFNTPESMGDTGKLSKEESVASLKHELERCVNLYRNKRHQAGLLQEELRVVRNTNQQTISELQDLQQQYAKAKEQLKDYEDVKKTMDSGGSSYKETKLLRQVENISTERDDLLIQIKDLEKRIEEIAESESQTKEFNRELSAQMAEMVRQFDEDKRQALLACEEAMNQHFESMKEAWRDEGKKEFEEGKERLDEVCRQLKFELEETKSELDDVKELYVKACNEKDELEDQINKEWDEKLTQDLERVKADLEEERMKEVESLKEQLTSESLGSLETAREKWMKEQEATFKNSVETEIVLAKTLWIQQQEEEKEAALKSAVEECDEKWSKKVEDEVQSALEKAQENWMREHDDILKEKIEEAHAEWRQNELPKFLENNRSSPRTSDTISSSEWQKEKMKLIQTKDEEKKLAVQEARSKLDEDYKIFMTDHKEALNNALKTCQEQNEKEKRELTTKYEDMIKMLREKQDVMNQSKETADEIEQHWKAKLAELHEKNEQEKEELAATHRQALYKALEEARNRWQQKFEEAMTEQEMEWNMDREKMLKEAENHVEVECQRLHEQHHQAIQELQAQHERHLDHALNQLREELTENGSNIEVAQMQHQMQQQEDQFNEEMRQLKQDLEEREQQIGEMQQELHKVQMQVVEQRQDLEHRLEKTEAQKQEAISAYSQSEKEHAHMIKSYKTRLMEMTDKLKRMENKLKAAGTGTQMQLQALQESMEREYSVAMETMKEKMLEMQLEGADKEAPKRKRTACTQTKDSSNPDSLDEMRSYYLEIITKIRKDVMQHVSKSNEEAAGKVRQEVLRERHFTAKRLRKYYLRCLDKLLDNFDGEDKAVLMSHMEQMLRNMPEKDSTCSSLSSKQGFRYTPDQRSSTVNSNHSQGIQADNRMSTQSYVYKSPLPSNEYPRFSKRSHGQNNTQASRVSNEGPRHSTIAKSNSTSKDKQEVKSLTPSGVNFSARHEHFNKNHKDNDATSQMLSTGESVCSSASNAWATPSELLSHLSPEHRHMLEKGASADPSVPGFSPPTTDKGHKPGKKYYKLDLQILDSDKYNPITNSTSKRTGSKETSVHEKVNVVPESNHKLRSLPSKLQSKLQTKDSYSLMKSNSDDCLNNSNTEQQQRKPMTSTELRNLTFRRQPKTGHLQGVGYGFLGSPPSKSQSMPNVADAAEKSDCDMSHVTERDWSFHKLPQSRDHQETVKHRVTQLASTKRSQPSLNKKEGYRVSFKNVDLDTTDASDSESVKSFVSTGSVSGFREALKNRRTHVREGGHRPLQISASMDYEKDDTHSLHRPIALVTRHTQMPSPLPSKRK